jgi:lysyl-tRNA synthetase class 2
VKATLIERARIIKSIRAFFDARDFIEVETPVRIAAPAPEEYIDCPPVATGGFLRASPELQMKKLLSMGMDKIYQIGPCFRDGEKGSRHNPEFTMIEWYRRDADYGDIADDLEKLFRELKGQLVPAEGFRRIAVRDAYREFAGWDPWDGRWERDRFDFDMATVIEPKLKEIGGGIFLMDYPPQAASLAKIRENDGAAVAERWEFYYDGMELANCFSELCDGVEQRRRFEAARAERRVLGEADYPFDEEFLETVGAIGKAAGVALGIDRLVMTLLGLDEITKVMSHQALLGV